MNNRRLIHLLCLSILICTLQPFFLFAAADTSPYMVVKTEDKTSPGLPLIHTGVAAKIAGVIADVTVTQVYVNKGGTALEAEYVFPASSHSAVYGMKMQIGDRVTIAKIKKKEKAKEIYEKAKAEGKSASLLQQHRPNIFQMNVANIQPGDTVYITLQYTELLVPENGVYEFVYPTIVGPRYAETEEEWMANMYAAEETSQIANKSHTFDIEIDLQTAIAMSDVGSPSHALDLQQPSLLKAMIGLQNGKGHEGDRDFVLRYRQAGDQIETGLLLYEGKKENFFLMMAQPPKRIVPEEIPPREYIFIVDVSGSMNGFPMDVSKTLIRELVNGLKEGDRFNIIAFASGVGAFSDKLLEATPSNLAEATDFLHNFNGAGGTKILPALRKALNYPQTSGTSRTVVIATDGLINVEKEAFELIREKLGEANFFPFGIGKYHNRFLIEGMAHAGQGESFVALTEEDALASAKKFKTYIETPILTNISLEIEGFNTYDVEPISQPDIFAEKPILVFGKYKGKPKGSIQLNGLSGTNQTRIIQQVEDFKPSDENEALSFLWARQKITILSDYNKLGSPDKKLVKEITNLGLQYNLLTEYTSFVAVDNKSNKEQKNKPKIKNITQSGAVPEPHEWALIGLFLLVFFVFISKRTMQ